MGSDQGTNEAVDEGEILENECRSQQFKVALSPPSPFTPSHPKRLDSTGEHHS